MHLHLCYLPEAGIVIFCDSTSLWSLPTLPPYLHEANALLFILMMCVCMCALHIYDIPLSVVVASRDQIGPELNLGRLPVDGNSGERSARLFSGPRFSLDCLPRNLPGQWFV